ncbi:MAG: hypothetical protein AB1724_12140 [Thermodesulfobacteriota bacterium]
MNHMTALNFTTTLFGYRQGLRVCLMALILMVSAGVFVVTECEAVLIFHKPAYTGRIIDMETREPLEGVVVVTVYQIDAIIGGPAGGWSKDIHAKETLTDKDGVFHIPAYTTLIGLNSRASWTKFIIFKPGYASYPWQQLKITPFQHCGPEWLFAGKIGTTTEINKKDYNNGIGRELPEKITVTFGLVELPKLNTWEERRIGSSISSPDFKVPLLDQMLKDEHDWLMRNQGWRR